MIAMCADTVLAMQVVVIMAEYAGYTATEHMSRARKRTVLVTWPGDGYG